VTIWGAPDAFPEGLKIETRHGAVKWVQRMREWRQSAMGGGADLKAAVRRASSSGAQLFARTLQLNGA